MINRHARALALSCALAMGVAGSQANGQSLYSGLTIFGDSLSDPGNIPKFLGLNYPPAPYYQNQFSNGPIYAKYLNGLLGIETPLQDYAIGGAMTGAGNIGGLPGNPSIGLPNAGIDGELTYYLSGNPHPGSRDLFIVWGGANDYFSQSGAIQALGLDAASLRSYALSATGPVTVAVGNLVADINRLARIGVKNFVVPNLPNLGATPDYNGDPTSSLDGTVISAAHNQALAQALHQLQQQLHVNITIVDTGTVFQDVVANPVKYGVDPAHTRDQCILSPACVANHQNYLFWDGVHPTGAVQQALSYIFYASLSGPTTVGPELEVDRVVQQDLFDHISARAAALRLGVTGLTVDGVAGAPTLAAGSDKPFAVYVTDSYGWGSRDATDSVAGFDYRHNITSAGLDYRLTDWAAIGAMIGYSETDTTLKNSMGSQSADSLQAAVYGTAYADGFYGAIAGTYAYDQWNKLNRNVIVGGQTAQAKANGRVIGGELQAGYVVKSGVFSFGPEAELRGANYRIGSYVEQGAVGLNQAVDAQGLSSLIGQFGFEAAMTTSLGDYAVVPHLRASFDHEFHGGTRAIVTRIASQPLTTTTTDLSAGGTDYGRLGAGVDVSMSDAVSALVDFDTTVGRNGGEDYGALVRVRAKF